MNYIPRNNCTQGVKHYERLNKIQDSEFITLEDMNFLLDLSCSSSSEVRAQIAEILGTLWNTDYKNEAHRILIKYLFDRDSLVRACACDAIGGTDGRDVLPILELHVRKDKNVLVRGYAASSIARVVINSGGTKERYIVYLTECVKFERLAWVRLNLYYALFILGENRFLLPIIKALFNKYYKIRGLAVSCLRDLINAQNKKFIHAFLRLALRDEETVIVRSMIANTFMSRD